jgi:hypothetical protein
LTGAGDIISTDPMLDGAGLQNNGGPTQTIALLAGSAAINAGNDANAPARDQRYFLRNGVSDIGAFEFGGALAPVTSAAAKTHGAAGVFAIDLPVIGAVGVECRSGGATGDHQVVLTFGGPVTINGNPQAQVTAGSGQIGAGGVSNGGVVTVSGSSVTVPLTNVANAQAITIRLNSVSDGMTTNNVSQSMGVLAGDTTGDRSVNSADIGQTKSKSGQAVGASNFRQDVTVDGSINSADVSFVKSKSGTSFFAGDTADVTILRENLNVDSAKAPASR